MITFAINDMTCGHCVRNIASALYAVDPGAKVSVELENRRVVIVPTTANAQTLQAAIEQAGYTPEALLTAASDPVPAPEAKAGCCGCH